MFKISFLTLFPESFPTTLGQSIIGRGLKNNLWEYEVIDLKKYGDKTGRVDDTPFGGGAGMILRADFILKALHDIEINERKIILTSASGYLFNQTFANEVTFSSDNHERKTSNGLIIICGRYEGVDHRLSALVDLYEISIGNYVLAGGEVAALVIAETCLRLIPGILGNEESLNSESHEEYNLEYPQYTKPRDINGLKVPEILLNGNHAKINEWRNKQSLEKTAKRKNINASINKKR